MIILVDTMSTLRAQDAIEEEVHSFHKYDVLNTQDVLNS